MCNYSLSKYRIFFNCHSNLYPISIVPILKERSIAATDALRSITICTQTSRSSIHLLMHAKCLSSSGKLIEANSVLEAILSDNNDASFVAALTLRIEILSAQDKNRDSLELFESQWPICLKNVLGKTVDDIESIELEPDISLDSRVNLFM